MDLPDDFDFDLDLDLDEVIPHATGDSTRDTAVGASQLHGDHLVDKIPEEVSQYAEGEVSHRASPDEQFLDSCGDLYDTINNEAMSHAPASFEHQDWTQKQRMSPLPCMDDTILDEDLQIAEDLDNQAPFDGEYMESSKYVFDSVPGKILQHGEGSTDIHAPYGEYTLESLDYTALEEAISRGKELGVPHRPEQPSMQSQENLVGQQLTQDAAEDVSHRASIDEAIHGPSINSSEDKVTVKGLQPSHGSCRAWVLPKEPDQEPNQEPPEAQALKDALQYTYENSLTTDYLLPAFSITHPFDSLMQSTIPATNEDGFTDHSHLADAVIPDPVVSDKCKTLTSTPRALKLIAEARLIQSEEAVQLLTEEVCNPDKSKPKKVELPLLRTDNERDMRAFQQRYVARSDALLTAIKKHRLPLYPQNLEEGEGMELSAESQAETVTMMKRSEEEKLGVTKDILIYLVNQLKDDYSTEDQMRNMIDEIRYDKISKLGKITPPVSPKLKPKQSAPVIDPVQLPIPSDDSSSLLSDNFHAIEDIMLGEHQDVWGADTSPIRELLKDACTISNQDAFWNCPRQTLDDLKIEVPLMLEQEPQHSGPTGPDTFGEFVKAEMDLDPEFERAVLHDISDDDLEEQLQEQLEQAARNTGEIVEQEQLQAIDAVGRVPIPVMDFLIPEPVWKRLCGSRNSERNILKWIQSGKEQLFKPPHWPLDRATASKMVWSPFAPGAEVMPENENMHQGESRLKSYLELPPIIEVPTSLSCIQQRKKPVVLVEEDRDEDLEAQLTREKPTTALMKSLRKRSMDTSAEVTPKRSRQTIEQTSHGRRPEHAGSSLLPGDSPGASGNLLANFMEVYAPKKRGWAHSRYFASAQTDAPSLLAPALPIAKQDNAQVLEQLKIGIKAPCPAIEPPSTPLTVFISIMIPRRMIRTLEGFISDLTLLERNYDSHNTFIWKPGSVVRTEVVPPLANDADITVSPSTGLIVTSMIRVRQKPRAGTNKGMVQLRVEMASLRYERLIVLVGGDGAKDDSVDVMSSSDSTALLELHGFASGLECNVQVHYVGGGEKSLANWVANCICRYGLADPQILAGLLEPETLWEVFLRRAGLNVFAAQAVASQFKPPSDERSEIRSAQYGLGAFMTMTRDERMRRFGQLVGPRTLQRVSLKVDELWNRV